MRPNLAVLRSAIGPMLTETGTVQRWTGETVFNEETGREEKAYETVYAGPVLVRPEAAVEIEVAGGTFTQGKYDVTFPADAAVKVGDLLSLTVCPWQPELVGHTIGLIDVPLDAWQVARFCKGESKP